MNRAEVRRGGGAIWVSFGGMWWVVVLTTWVDGERGGLFSSGQLCPDHYPVYVGAAAAMRGRMRVWRPLWREGIQRFD